MFHLQTNGPTQKSYILFLFTILILLRAEKERTQYFAELNDARIGCDQLSNEKVYRGH